jgi:hypothetical protein
MTKRITPAARIRNVVFIEKSRLSVQRYGVQQRRASAVCCNALFDSDVVVLPETDVIGNTVTHQVHLGIPPDAG